MWCGVCGESIGASASASASASALEEDHPSTICIGSPIGLIGLDLELLEIRAAPKAPKAPKGEAPMIVSLHQRLTGEVSPVNRLMNECK